jgi:hypothetical protein
MNKEATRNEFGSLLTNQIERDSYLIYSTGTRKLIALVKINSTDTVGQIRY